jgi:hypothetical protein
MSSFTTKTNAAVEMRDRWPTDTPGRRQSELAE